MCEECVTFAALLDDYIKMSNGYKCLRYLLLGGALCASYGQMRAQRIVTQEECVALALEHNKELKVQQLEVANAELKVEEVKSYLVPQLSVNMGVASLSNSFHLVDWDYILGPLSSLLPEKIRRIGEIKTDNIRVISTTAIQPLFMGGKIYYGSKMAQTATRLAKAKGEVEEHKVAQGVTATYWQLVSLSSKERLLVKLNKLLEEARRDVDVAIATGVATRASALEIGVKQSDAELKLQQVRNGLTLLKMLLSEQCGLPLEESLLPREAGLLDSLVSAPLPPPSRLLANEDILQAVALRPEVRALHLADSVFSYKEKVARSEMLPKIFAVMGYTATGPNLYNYPFSSMKGGWIFGLGMSVPITGIWRGSIGMREARNERQSYRYKLLETEEKIQLQIRQQLYKEEEARKQLESAERGLKLADENLRMATLGYKEGVIPLINLTQAQTAWAAAHDAYIDAYVKLSLEEALDRYIIPQRER